MAIDADINVVHDIIPKKTQPFTEKFTPESKNPTLAMPGFPLSGKMTMQRLCGALNQKGIHAITWGWELDLGPSNRAMKRIEKQLEQCYKDAGNQKITLVAHSLGASLALHFARKRPDLVARVVSLAGTIQLDLEKVAQETNAAAALKAMEVLSPLYDQEVMQGVIAEKDQATPLVVEVTAIAAKNDPLVDPRMSLMQEYGPDGIAVIKPAGKGFINLVLNTDHTNIKKLQITADIAAHSIQQGIDVPLPAEITSQLVPITDLPRFEGKTFGQMLMDVTQAPRDLLHEKINAPIDLVAHRSGNILFGNAFGENQPTLLTAGPNFDR